MYAPNCSSIANSHQFAGSFTAKYDRRCCVRQPPMCPSLRRANRRRNAVSPSYQSWLPGNANRRRLRPAEAGASGSAAR